jgi:hypothetical protein
MNSKLIILNGGKGCGKSVAVKALKEVYPHLVERQCKDQLHKLTMALFNVPEDEYWRIYEDRELKEKPNEYFRLCIDKIHDLKHAIGKREVDFALPDKTTVSKYGNSTFVELWYISIRHAMIFVSECICKPSFGQDYFGISRAASIQDNELVLDDSALGTIDEVIPAINKLGEDNVLAIRIRGRGNFEGDSRKFLPDNCMKNMIDIWNDKSEDEFIATIKEEIEKWLNNGN